MPPRHRLRHASRRMAGSEAEVGRETRELLTNWRERPDGAAASSLGCGRRSTTRAADEGRAWAAFGTRPTTDTPLSGAALLAAPEVVSRRDAFQLLIAVEISHVDLIRRDGIGLDLVGVDGRRRHE